MMIEKDLVERIVHYTDEEDAPEVHAAIIKSIGEDGTADIELLYAEKKLAGVPMTTEKVGTAEARGKWSLPQVP